MKIECIPYKLDPDEGTKLFKSRMRRFRLGQFRFDTGFFLPYYLFRVEVLNAGKLSTEFLAIDAMTGELDLYKFDSEPTEFDEVETSQVGETFLNEKQAFSMLQDQVRRMVFMQGGFFKTNQLTISGSLVRLLYIPYWVGFFLNNKQLAIEVIDAVRGRFEGGKMREVIMDWFARESKAREQRKKT